MRRQEHIAAGSLTAVGTYLLLKYNFNEKPTVKGILFSLLGGAIAGVLPDRIESDPSPNHRNFFHSILFGLLIGYMLFKVYKNENISNAVKIIMGVLTLAYESHLILDYNTPKSLPFLIDGF